MPPRAWLALLIIVFSILLFLQVHFVALRGEHSVAWSWAATLTPLWIINVLIGLPLLVSTARVLSLDVPEHSVVSDSDRDEVFYEGVEHLVALIFFGMLLGTEIMLVQRFDGSHPRTFFAIFGPLYAGIGVLLLFGCGAMWAQCTNQEYI